MKQPDLTEAQWRTIYDVLIEQTPLSSVAEREQMTTKQEVEWYRRSAIIQSIRNTFGWRTRKEKKPQMSDKERADRAERELEKADFFISNNLQ